ncbi:MAG: hypothetical protein GTO02_21925 [Candidatus Dadabacteria bacterium]|nr:hypothetical protein [Candidatus Dadabacteria bacterium]NIQ16944.1 hypothetical protein [Candidatus Dadabacteria bacterium]
MKYFKYLILAIITAIPVNTFSGGLIDRPSTDLSGSFKVFSSLQLSAYYDLRDRESYIQVTNFSSVSQSIHIQIFQHDRNCDELDFFDELTPNDTVIYDMNNIVKNNGDPAPINLQDNSYGYVVISKFTPGTNELTEGPALIGNFRIIDDAGYEYRSNMIDIIPGDSIQINSVNYIANFNTIDNANFSDVIGYSYDDGGSFGFSTVTNVDNGFSFDIFVFDMDEEPLSCDRRNFACGNIMNYGINEDYPASRGNNLLCPGGGLANPQGGYISFVNGLDLDGNPPGSDGNDDIFIGLIGINNGNSTGSMDIWFISEGFIVEG